MQDRKKELQQAIADIVKASRRGKSITKSAEEIGMGKSIWAYLENGNKDPQISTFWRIAEAFEMKPSELLKKIEVHLGENFSFLEDFPAKKN